MAASPSPGLPSHPRRGWLCPTLGRTCWTDLWRARSFAIKRLRQVAAHLQSPELARAFSFWNWHLEQKVRIKHEKQMAVVEKTLEGKLRQSQFEAGQLAMLKVKWRGEASWGGFAAMLAELCSSVGHVLSRGSLVTSCSRPQRSPRPRLVRWLMRMRSRRCRRR